MFTTLPAPAAGVAAAPGASDLQRALESELQRTAPMTSAAFIRELDELHRNQGTTLQTEPVLGGKKLDLLKIYRLVMQAGGYEAVTRDRGGWRRIGIPFDLPPTCTNSAFIFKQVYQKNLLVYELLHTGQPITSATILPLLGRQDGSAGNTPRNKRSRADASTPIYPSPQLQFQLQQQQRMQQHLLLQQQQQQQQQMLQQRQLAQMNQQRDASSLKTNPDDGNDARYLQGGWHNRLTLALRSQLPNEIDWAFNKLIKITYDFNFQIGILPGLAEVLIEHMQPLFGSLILNTSPLDFETTLMHEPDMDNGALGWEVSANSDQRTQLEQHEPLQHRGKKRSIPHMLNLKSLCDVPFFANTESAILLERVHQALHIFRNLSFMADNAAHMSKDSALVTLLAKAVALPATTNFVEIKQYALDIYENLAAHLVLRGPSDFYLACLKKMIFESDRSRVIGSLRSLIRLASNETNERVILAIDTSTIQRLIQLLLVPDEEILVGVMEFLYLFTSTSPDSGLRITQCVRFNVIRLLLKFVKWHNHGADHALIANRPPGPPPTLAPPPAPQRPPSYLASHAVDHFQAAIWLQGILEADAKYAISSSALLGEYERYCKAAGLKAITPRELTKLIQSVYGSKASFLPTMIQGVRPRADSEASLLPCFANLAPSAADTAAAADVEMHDTEEEVDAGQVTPSSTAAAASSAAAAAQTPMVCAWMRGTCNAATTSTGVVAHVLRDHDTSALVCEWKQCTRYTVDRPAPSVQHLARHLWTHVSAATAGATAGVGATTPAAEAEAKGAATSAAAAAVPPHIYPDPAEDLRGIPLCALLILRNIARHPDNAVFFGPFEADLTALVVEPRYSKVVGSILSDLKS
ncbi:hypothetical protein BC831DRAFT_484971 [Entophlyctis helioformis]|nr:hypothetical protein BC831DRAFT_484971 [Entophlyctis helioformis]